MRLFKSKAAGAVFLTLGLAACAREGDIQQTGILTSYTACPPVAIVAPTGDVTLFNPASSRDANAIDVVAHITNLRSTCDESGEHIVTQRKLRRAGAEARQSRRARRRAPLFRHRRSGRWQCRRQARRQVGLHFDDGQYRATPPERRPRRCCARRRPCPRTSAARSPASGAPGDADAAIDPMADPAVRSAVEPARFELLVGFELTADQLTYNATR